MPAEDCPRTCCSSDEAPGCRGGDLPVLQETLSHAEHPRTILTGTPKLIDNHLEGMFTRSTANIWTIPCHGCGQGTTIDERCLGTTGLICPTCQSDLDASQGAWVPLNPHSTWGQGFSISHPMVPWFKAKYSEILECQRNYDLVRFRNEVLGLPATLGDHVVTRAELEACCGSAECCNTVTINGSASARHCLPEWIGEECATRGRSW